MVSWQEIIFGYVVLFLFVFKDDMLFFCDKFIVKKNKVKNKVKTKIKKVKDNKVERKNQKRKD